MNIRYLFERIKERSIKHIAICIIICSVIISLLPFFLNVADLKQLIWFGDSWDLLNQLQNQGLFSWVFSCFAENFVPVFKILWFGSIKMIEGSYFLMLGILWVTHAMVVLLFGLLLVRFKVGLPGLGFAILLLGTSWTNIETLIWSVQWSASLAVIFFLLAFHILLSMLEESQFDIARSLLYCFFVICSSLSFSRGVLSGVITALFYFLSIRNIFEKSKLRLIAIISASILPAIFTASIIYLFSTGNHKSIFLYNWNIYKQMAEFGGAYFFLNPLAMLFFQPWSPWQNVIIVISLVVFKIIVIYFGLHSANTEQRRLIIAFLLMDLCNALLLGIGRYHTGLQAALSYRYQYVSFVCFGVPLALAINSFFNKMISSRRAIYALSIAMYLLITSYNLYCWKRELPSWCYHRGVVARMLLDNLEKTESMPGIPFINNHEAAAISKRFNLH